MLSIFCRFRHLVWICWVSACATSLAHAQAAERCTSAVLTLSETAALLRIQPEELEELATRAAIPARRIGNDWRFNCASIMTWLEGDSTAAPAVDSVSSQRSLSAAELQGVTGAGIGIAQEQAPEPSERPTALDGGPIGEAPQDRTAEDVLLRDQRVLVRPREVTLNFGQFYSESDSLILASTDEGNVLAAVEQAALLTTFQARIGVGRESELFLATSYARQESGVFLGNEKLAGSTRTDVGDVLVGYRHTLATEGVDRRSVIGTVTAYVPTGDGPHAIGGGLGFLKSFDPVALFATLNYTRTFNEDIADIRLRRPKDRLDASMGFALALNDTLSLSGAVSAVFTGASRAPDADLRQQDAYGLGFGLTARVSRRIYLEPAVSLTLGGPADGFSFGLSAFTFKQ
jgi:hypothetical protein